MPAVGRGSWEDPLSEEFQLPRLPSWFLLDNCKQLIWGCYLSVVKCAPLQEMPCPTPTLKQELQLAASTGISC